MGYGTLAYAVDLDRLRSAYGSKDRAMFQAIEKREADDIRDRDEWFRDRIKRGAPSLREAVAQIIEGQINAPPWAGFQYGYALELLCKHLGHVLENRDRVSFIEHLGTPTGLTSSGPPLPISRPEDFPSIGFLTADQVGDEYLRLKDQDLSHERKDLEWAREEFRSFLRLAFERKLALVTFTY